MHKKHIWQVPGFFQHTFRQKGEEKKEKKEEEELNIFSNKRKHI